MGRGGKGWFAGSRRRPESRPLRRERHRCRRPVAQRRVRTLRVVHHPPLLDHHLCLSQRIENFSVQAFVSELPVEAFAVAVRIPEIFTRENHSNCTIGTDDVPADPEGHNRGLLESDLGEPRLSFLISTLGWDPTLDFFFILGDIGEFLIKDIVLRGAVL
jgi:hypothetical protein